MESGDNKDEEKKKKKKKPGRRRRGKKDVILDFSKRAKSTKQLANESNGQESQQPATRNRISLATSRRDYEGNLGLPDKVVQREFETTGQFFRRLDRLAAKAKVEANIDERYQTNLGNKHLSN